MKKKNLLVGLGGAGKSAFNKMILDYVINPKKPEFIVVDCSEHKNDTLNSNNIPMEENTNE